MERGILAMPITVPSSSAEANHSLLPGKPSSQPRLLTVRGLPFGIITFVLDATLETGVVIVGAAVERIGVEGGVEEGDEAADGKLTGSRVFDTVAMRVVVVDAVVVRVVVAVILGRSGVGGNPNIASGLFLQTIG